MPSSLTTPLKQLQSHLGRMEKLRAKQMEIVERAIGEVDDLEDQITALGSGNGQSPAAKKPAATKQQKKPANTSFKMEGDIKVFAESGKGRRQCPKCDRIVGVRTSICACGYNFETKRQGKPPVAAQADKPDKPDKPKGRGRKNGMTNREAVLAVLEETNGKKLRLGEIVDHLVRKNPSSAKKASVTTMVSGILKSLIEEGLVEKDEDRRHSLKKVVAKASAKKPAAKKKSAKRTTKKKSAA